VPCVVTRPAWHDGEVGFRVGVLAEDQRRLLSQPPPDPESRSDRLFGQSERDRMRRVHRSLLQDDAIDEHRRPALEHAHIAEAVELGARPAQRPRAGRARA